MVWIAFSKSYPRAWEKVQIKKKKVMMWIEFNKSYPRAWEKLPKQSEEGIHTVRPGTGEDTESPANTPSCPAPAPAKGRIPPWVLASCPAPQCWPDYPEGLWSAPFAVSGSNCGGNSSISMNEVLMITTDSGGTLVFLKGTSCTCPSTQMCRWNFSCLVIWLRFECFNCQCVRQTVRSANCLI